MSEKTGICIVWPAFYEGSTNPEAHVTALFLGNTDTAAFHREDAEDAVNLLGAVTPGEFPITGTALFGKNKDKSVLLLGRNPRFDLHWDVTAATNWLKRSGITPSTLFPFNPHITVPEGTMTPAPKTVHLAAPTLWWGDERAVHPEHAKREGAVNAAIAAVREEHGDWIAGMMAHEQYRPIVASAVHAALKAAA